MNDIFLGTIAFGVLVMAAIQVAGVIYAVRLARRVDQLADQIDRDIRPMVADLKAVTADATRAMALVAAQVERADRLFGGLTTRVEQVIAVVHEKIFAPLREGASLLSGLGAALAALRELRQTSGSPGPTVEEEDTLFIG